MLHIGHWENTGPLMYAYLLNISAFHHAVSEIHICWCNLWFHHSVGKLSSSQSRYKFSNFHCKGWILILAQRQLFLWSDSLTETHIWLTIVCQSFFQVKGVFYGQRSQVSSQPDRLQGCLSRDGGRTSACVLYHRGAFCALLSAPIVQEVCFHGWYF